MKRFQKTASIAQGIFYFALCAGVIAVAIPFLQEDLGALASGKPLHAGCGNPNTFRDGYDSLPDGVGTCRPCEECE